MKKIKLCLDSGAFTAFTQDKTIDISKYCDFINTNSKYIYKSVNLDSINPKNPEQAASIGMENYLYMKEKGIEAMPVLHARESFSWLDKMIDSGAKYIGLSGTSLVSPIENKFWHKIVWNYVTDKKGYPVADFHAFGDVAPQSMLTCPWRSSDSATWMIQAGRAARVKLAGKTYQLHSRVITDSNFISNNDPLPQKLAWQQEFRTLGMDPDKLMAVTARGSEMAMLRSYLVAADLLRLQEKSKYCHRFQHATLLSQKRQLEGGKRKDKPVEMYFVISPSAYYFNFPIIYALKIKRILVSYYYVTTATKNFWEEKLLPFITDPDAFVQSEPKVKRYLEKLSECLVQPVI